MQIKRTETFGLPFFFVLFVICNEHCIAEAEKAVALPDGFRIGVHGVVIACECGDQHDERGFGQMKIRNQSVDTAELIRRIDENAGIALAGTDFAVFRGSALQRAA